MAEERMAFDSSFLGDDEAVQMVMGEVIDDYSPFLAEFGAAVRNGDDEVAAEVLDDASLLVDAVLLGRSKGDMIIRAARTASICANQVDPDLNNDCRSDSRSDSSSNESSSSNKSSKRRSGSGRGGVDPVGPPEEEERPPVDGNEGVARGGPLCPTGCIGHIP